MNENAHERRRYAAFISYSHENSDWAGWVHRAIEHYRLPRRLAERDPALRAKLKPVFRDREELPTAGNLGEKITEALSKSRALIVICSPASARSKWTNQEILEYKRRHGEESILCLIVDGEPGTGDERECFPPALRFRLAPDGSLSDLPAEPLAADVRAGKDGKNLAKLKLIAGLLGVGLDELRQRDQQRRNRQLLAITVASLAGMALTGYLAFVAMVARDDAERRQQQAEGLIEFMLGDLKRELGEVGRLDALDATARKAVAYFSELPEKDLDDDTLVRRAEAYRAIGEIHFDRLEWDQAQQVYQMAMDANRELFERNPGSPDLLYELAQSEFWVGYVLMESGDLGSAEPYFLDYLEHARNVLEFDPQNPDWVMEVSYANTNLAGLYEQLGQNSKALEHALEGVNWNRKAADLAPQDVYYREELVGALDWLSRAQLRAGLLLESSASRREAASINRKILSSEPENRLAQQRLAASMRGQAWPLNFLGQHEQALGVLDGALAHFQAITEHDPTNELWAFWYMDAALDRLMFMHDAALENGPPGHVFEPLRRYANTAYPEDTFREGRRLLAAGVLALYQGSGPEASSALHQLEQMVMGSEDGKRAQQALAHLYLFVADKKPDININRDTLNSLISEFAQQAENSSNPIVLSLHAQLVFEFGDSAGIKAVVERLEEMGFATRRFAQLTANARLGEP